MKTITINERTKAGKTLLELATLLATNNKGVSIETGLGKPALKTVKNLTPSQKKWINGLRKVKQDVANGNYKGQSLKSFLDEL